MYRLSGHFEARWQERVGGPVPSAEELTEVIKNEKETICLQKYRHAYTPRGRSIVFMAIYWIAPWNCVVKVHEKGKKLITVMSLEILEERRKGG